jgi:phytoene dehydrogenase-like protein
MTQKYDVVIIGGGLAGYVAANYLAKSNVSILIVEKGMKSGGRARTDVMKQQSFNLGPHALYKKGKAKPILHELGVKLHGKSPKMGATLIDNNSEYTAPFSPLGLLSTNHLNWKERLEWIRVIFIIMRSKPDRLANQTYKHWVEETTPSIKVQSLLYVLGRLSTYCHAHELVCAKVIVSHLQLVLAGVLYLDGGWQTIIDQLHNKAVMSGVQVRTHETVKQIIHVEEEIKVFVSNNEQITAKYVISTMSPQILSKMLDISAYNFTPLKGATLDVALTQLPNPKRLFALGVTEPYYYSVHSTAAHLSNNPNNFVLHVFKYYHPNDEIDGNSTKIELESFLERFQPGWKDYVITSRYIPQLTVNHRLPQVGDDQLLKSSKTGIPGLYLAGDWASPEFILSEGTICSGKHAAEAVLQDTLR